MSQPNQDLTPHASTRQCPSDEKDRLRFLSWYLNDHRPLAELTTEAGMSLDRSEIVQAAAEAGRERLQPILMTSVASLAGFFPLVIAQSVGANSQQSIGTVVFGSMIMGTILSLLVVPPVYVIIKNLERRFFSRQTTTHPS